MIFSSNKPRFLFRKLFIALGSAFFAVSTSISASDYSPNFKNTEIGEFINIVGKSLKKTIIVDPNVRGKVTVRSHDLLNEEQYYQFFQNVLQVYGFSVIEMPSGILKVIRSKDAKASNTPVVDDQQFIGDEMITRVMPIYNVPSRDLAPLLRQLVDTAGGGNVVSHDPSNALMLTGRAALVNRLVKIIERVDQAGDEEVEIIKLQYASASEMVRIVESINKSQGKAPAANSKAAPRLVADDRTNSVIVSGGSKARLRLVNLIKRMDQELETSGNTRVIFLNYSKAEDLVKVLNGVSSSIQAEASGAAAGNARSGNNNRAVSIDSHEDSNALVITAEPDMMRSLEEVIRQLDIRRAQVQVEAIIVEVFEGDGVTLGVQVGSEEGGGTQFTNGVVGIGSLAVAADTARDEIIVDSITTTDGGTPVVVPTERTELGDTQALGALLGGVNGLIAGFVEGGWAAVVQAVSTDTNSNILATPHLTTMDNEEAFFIVGQEVPIITGSTTGSNNANPFQQVDRQEVGIKLKVTPQINEGDAVQLLIEQEVSSISGATSVDIITNKREIKTSVIVDDGGTIVLGGLIDDDVQESVSKVPILGDIPFIGNLFKSTTTSKTKRNLMVFIRPTIVRDGATMNEISHRKYQYIRGEQLKRQSQGIPLMPRTEGPTLPEWNEKLTLPPNFEEYLMNKDKKDQN
jgi:general secretion pathway protein D